MGCNQRLEPLEKAFMKKGWEVCSTLTASWLRPIVVRSRRHEGKVLTFDKTLQKKCG